MLGTSTNKPNRQLLVDQRKLDNDETVANYASRRPGRMMSRAAVVARVVAVVACLVGGCASNGADMDGGVANGRSSGDQVPAGIRRIGGGYLAPKGPGWPPSVAIVDTGIDISNPELNVVGGIDCATESRDDWSDTDGHGTSLAGIVGARRDGEGIIGVAPGAELYSVRVFANETQATEERVLCGLRWVLDHAYKIDVALVAFNRVDDSVADDSTCEVDVLRSIVCALSEAGVTVVVAAGNQKADASGFVPAKLVEVITVGAFVDFDGLPGGFGSPTCGPGVDDGLADFSNTGPNIDILAPGVCIETVGLNGDESTVVPSGTSLAAAHVAGVAAIYKACHVDAAPDEVRTALLAAAETVSIEDVDFSLVSAWEFDRNSCRDVNHDA